MANYTQEKEKGLNSQLKKWQNQAKRLILSDYYDSAAESLNELHFSILQQVTKAKTHKDINTYLWESGMIEKTLDTVAEKIKKVRRECSRKGR